MAAPVGVVSSPCPSKRAGRSRRISSVAGAGTGMRPCIVSTIPLPSGGGAENTSGCPSSSSASAAPQTSTMLSTAPTSWKWTDSSGTSWILASARR
jgi:hypothetical protein